VPKVNEVFQVFLVSVVAKEGKAFQGHRESRDRQAYVVNPGTQAHLVEMENRDYQVRFTLH